MDQDIDLHFFPPLLLPLPLPLRNYDYSQLNVGPELKDLFEFIERYKPSEVVLDTRLKPFIPDFIPAVGDIDAFLKVMNL